MLELSDPGQATSSCKVQKKLGKFIHRDISLQFRNNNNKDENM